MRWLITLLISCAVVIGKAQTPADYWYFGDHAGLHFGVSPMTIFDGNHSNGRAISSVSDFDGILQFYSRDTLIWNRNHEVMPNGSGISSSSYSGQISCVPYADSTFLLFTLDFNSIIPFPSSLANLYYHEISMDLELGLGDVSSSTKNVFLQDSLTTKIASVPKCGAFGHWIIARSGANTNIYSYEVTELGLNSTPVISSGMVIPDSCCRKDGYIRPSPNGEHVIISHPYPSSLEFFDFDRTNGALTPNFTLDFSTSGMLAYGLEFSSSGAYLYCSLLDLTGANPSGAIIQFNVEAYDSASIISSLDTVFSSALVEGIQRGPDEKIYLTTVDSFLSIIHFPDVESPGCDFEENAISLNGLAAGSGLPNFNSFLLSNPVADQFICAGDSIYFSYPDSCVESVRWTLFNSENEILDTSSSFNSAFVFSDTGDFKVTLMVQQGLDTTEYTGEVVVIPSSIPNPLPDSTSICFNQLLESSHSSTHYNFEWSNGSDSSSTMVSADGWYALTVSNYCFELVDSVFVMVLFPPSIDLSDMTLCQTDTLTIGVQAQYYDNVLWSTGDSSSKINVGSWNSTDLSPLNIWLNASNACGEDSDSMTLFFLPNPDAGLPQDSVQCSEQTVPIYRPSQDNTVHLWSNGSSDSLLLIQNDTLIWLVATNLCGSDTDSMWISFHPPITVSLGEASYLCEGDSVVLNASWPGATYHWNPGGSTDSIQVVKYEDLIYAEDRLYTVTITDGPCNFIASKNVSVNTEHCDSSACKFSIPNVFTPNEDGINDVLRVDNDCSRIRYSITVFNRWGQVMFEGGPQNNAWDGYMNGDIAAPGTYFVVVEYGKNKIQKCSISLLR
ncbi:MAG: gliding motility-associated C-terminal domain-containing protein [Cryomorphaceae bacterium]